MSRGTRWMPSSPLAPLAILLALATPAMASGAASEGGQSGSVVFAESLGDAAKRVDGERRAAPRAKVDIASVQFTQTHGLLTLSVQLRRLRAATVDRLGVNLDTDGDAVPDVGVQWTGAEGAPAIVELEGFRTPVATIDCPRVEIAIKPTVNLIEVTLGRSCLAEGGKPGVRSLQVAVRDRVDRVNDRGELVEAKWDFLGGRTTMVAVTF